VRENGGDCVPRFARNSLRIGITTRKGARFIADDLPEAKVHPVTSYADMTDACLVALAKARGLKLATLDGSLSGKAWAKGVAENSF
jgi:predicted nucleic acid-binding protein